MTRCIAIDTNAYSALMAGDENVASQLAGAKLVIVPIAVLGELHDGFKNGLRAAFNERKLREFLDLANVETPGITAKTAEIYATIKNYLREQGRPVPTNDIWIAAQALENHAVILTFDKHFAFMEECGVVLAS